MKRFGTIWFVMTILILAMLLAACNAGGGEPAAVDGTEEPVAGDAPQATEEPEPSATPAVAGDGLETLVEALRDAGLAVEVSGVVEDPFFDGQAQLLTVGEALIQVYQFEDEAQAEAAAQTVNASGTIIGTTTVDWIEPPHFYREGRLIALYAGTDEAIISALQAELGEPFVVGQTMGLPPADGAGIATDLTSLVEALNATGATVEIVEGEALSLFDTAAQTVEVNGMQVQIFEFADEAAAQAAAATVGEDGTSIGDAVMRWAGSPHFFQQGRLIALYLGNDADVLSLLESVMGAQFAGSPGE